MSFFRGGGANQPPPQGSYSRLSGGSQAGIPSGPRAGREMPPPPSSNYDRRGAYGSNSPAQYGSPMRGQAASRQFVVRPVPTDDDSKSNRVIVNRQDFSPNQHIMVQQQFALTTREDRTGEIGPGQVGLSMLHRQWIGLNEGEAISIAPIDLASLGQDVILGSLDLAIGFMKPRIIVEEVFSVDDLAHYFLQQYNNMMCSPGQMFFFDYHGQKMKATVKGVQSMGPQRFGLLDSGTDITIGKAADSAIKLKSSAKKPPPNAILAPNFRFEDVGIGGLDAEFAAIFRRAFASRMFPRGLVEKLGIRHVKGLLLYGPPGTGKTLMARQIGKMLNAKEPKIVNGPEILSKYVGASEENVRKLFADAEKEYKEKGDESDLHIIIFDELDAITKQRGSTNSGTGVGDTVVNQLLSKMDGVDQLNNILIIGMTNRRDMIDEALLRPGRLEVHVEISLPDEHGRLQILAIHTAKMTKEGLLDRDVNIAELAALTKNFSGAEIEGLVKSATSFAFQRHIKVGTTAGISDDIENLRVSRNDFMLALEEVHPAFGVSEEELAGLVQNGIIHYDETVESILQRARLLVEQVRTSTRTPLVSVLLHGLAGTGKTALAATIAKDSEYPFIKLVSPDQMVGFSEQQKVQAINKIFNDSYKSPLSVIVVDNIERLIDWVKIGSRFSNAVVQTLMVLMGRRPPNGRRLLILATTSNRAMVEELEMAELFDSELRVSPLISLAALETVLDDVQLLQDQQERYQVMSSIAQAFRPRTKDEQSIYGETKLSIGIKKLLNLTEMARLDPGQIGERLVSSLIEQSGGSMPERRMRLGAGQTSEPLMLDQGGGMPDGGIPERRARRISPPSASDEVSPGYYPGISI